MTGLRKDFDAVKGQLKSVEETISKSADTGSKKFDEMGNQISGFSGGSYASQDATVSSNLYDCIYTSFEFGEVDKRTSKTHPSNTVKYVMRGGIRK